MSATGRPFVLDRVENPHPRMLREGWELRRLADMALDPRNVAGEQVDVARWEGFLQAMCAATGCGPAELLDWMDRHPPEGVSASS